MRPTLFAKMMTAESCEDEEAPLNCMLRYFREVDSKQLMYSQSMNEFTEFSLI